MAWINVLGSYASQVIVPAAQAISVPDQFTTTQALMFQSLTAQYLVTETAIFDPAIGCWSTRPQVESDCCWFNVETPRRLGDRYAFQRR